LWQGGKREDRVFKKFSYRGIDLDALLGLSKKDLMDKLLARQRRRLSSRGLQPKTQVCISPSSPSLSFLYVSVFCFCFVFVSFVVCCVVLCCVCFVCCSFVELLSCSGNVFVLVFSC
jgi:hypothetical protein